METRKDSARDAQVEDENSSTAREDGRYNTEADSRIAAVGNSEKLRQPQWSSWKTQRKCDSIDGRDSIAGPAVGNSPNLRQAPVCEG